MQRMEMSPYVNVSSRPKPIRNPHPAVTERKWFQNLILSFGLLCLIQATLNVTLRLTLAKSECNATAPETQTLPPTPDDPQQCNRLRERVKSLERDSSRLENDKRELNKQINSLNSQINQLNNRNNDLTNLNKTRVNQINAKNDQIKALKKQNEQLNNEVAAVATTNNGLTGENRILNNQISDLNNQIRNLRGENRRLNDKISELTINLRPSTVNPVCPNGWFEMKGRCYYLSGQSEKKFWDDSRSQCQSQGADLVVINDEQEQRDLYNIYGDSELNIWIGLHDETNSGTFRWVDNTTLTTAFWQDGQPGDGGPNNPENCVEIYYKKAVLSSWNDAPCRRHKRRWICEKEAS